MRDLTHDQRVDLIIDELASHVPMYIAEYNVDKTTKIGLYHIIITDAQTLRSIHSTGKTVCNLDWDMHSFTKSCSTTWAYTTKVSDDICPVCIDWVTQNPHRFSDKYLQFLEAYKLYWSL
jgi:rRNA maturation protein Nop10